MNIEAAKFWAKFQGPSSTTRILRVSLARRAKQAQMYGKPQTLSKGQHGWSYFNE